jgi:AmiR/NasT family two-component response regulator
MARHQLDEDAAFKLLVKLSQQTHIKLRDIAARIVRDACAS